MNQRGFYLCTGIVVTQDRLSLSPDDHIVGELRYVEDEGHRVTALAIYDESIATNAPLSPDLAALNIRMLAIGDARNIRCTKCGRVGRWEIGKAAVVALLQKRSIRSPGPIHA